MNHTEVSKCLIEAQEVLLTAAAAEVAVAMVAVMGGETVRVMAAWVMVVVVVVVMEVEAAEVVAMEDEKDMSKFISFLFFSLL